MLIEKYSMGIGDRFARQGIAQLRAFVEAAKAGVKVTPVWNKSNREHLTIKTKPDDVRIEADEATRTLEWNKPYHVDADHIGLETVDRFIASSDFFTLDVADFTGKPADPEEVEAFTERNKHLADSIVLPGQSEPLSLSADQIKQAAMRYLLAVKEAGSIFRHIADTRDPDTFITEVSMDETDTPQTPAELLVILAAIAEEKIPAQTIAPKFSGRFNKGVDYVGDVQAFAAEFEADIAVVQYAIQTFDLPPSLKLSVHSGSDKFAIYPVINHAIKKADVGLHIKTAGTTWLEEVIGLANANPEGLAMAKQIYTISYARYDELCSPYAAVIDIDPSQLPAPETVFQWDGATFAHALRHELSCSNYNPHLRQLIHVGYKVAAEMGTDYLHALDACASTIAEGVTHNILNRHLLPVFG